MAQIEISCWVSDAKLGSKNQKQRISSLFSLFPVESCGKQPGARLRKSIKLNFKQLKTEIVRFKIISTGLLLARLYWRILWFHCTMYSVHPHGSLHITSILAGIVVYSVGLA